MKKILIISVALSLFATSCSWLDITPEDIVVEDELFKESQGFQNAINGLYKTMASSDLYGRELSYGFVEVLSQNYLNTADDSWFDGINNYSPYYPIATKYNYESEGAKQMIEGMWGKAYFVIANANNILMNIDNLTPDKFKFGAEERNLIKGEALAVRALMHFEMLRLFAPAPQFADEKVYIPYVEIFPYYGGQAKENVESVMKKIERDFLEAKELIKSYDTMGNDQLQRLSPYIRYQLSTGSSNYDAFYEYRGYRINVVAVTGLLARMYDYWGKYDEAFAQAAEAAGFIYDEANKSYALDYTRGNNAENDRKFSYDLMFGLSDPHMTDNYQLYSVRTSNSFFNLNYNRVQFEGTPEADAGDYRYKYQVERYEKWGDVSYRPLKYIALDGGTDVTSIANRVADILPVIRLSEMHFIMAEAKAAEGNFSVADGANYYLNLVRAGRNCRKMDLGITDMDSFKRQLFMEVRKECFSEGQTFYYYKKYNELITSKMKPGDFVIPTPSTEEIN